MSLKNCPECNNQISSKAESCPSCGCVLKKKSKQYGCGSGCAVVILILVIIGAISSIMKDSTHSPSSSKTPSSSTYNASDRTRPGTTERIEKLALKYLSSSNREEARLYKIKETGDAIQIGFTINDNLTDGMIKTGTQSDVMKILKAVKASQYNYSKVTVIGTFPLVDKFGNSEEETVLQVSYSPATVNKINWDGFQYSNVFDIADSVWLHPSFYNQ